jgi:hypothetical protein
MARRADALKLASLATPLLVGVLGLHVFGTALGEALGKLRAGGPYEPFSHKEYLVYARAGSHYHEFAATALDTYTRAMLERYGGALRLRPPDTDVRRLTVRLFDTMEDLLAKAPPGAQADVANNSGYFLPEDLVIGIRVLRDQPADQAGLQHQMTHALLRLAAPQADWSPWLNEGLAEYFERSRPELDPPLFGGHYRENLSGPDFVPLADLLRAGAREFGGARNRTFARESHLLVAFLLEAPGYRERFFTYYEKELQEGPVSPETFAECVGDPAAVQADWLSWLRSPE